MKSINDFLHVVDDLDLIDLFSNIGAIFLAGKIQVFFLLNIRKFKNPFLRKPGTYQFIQADLVFRFFHIECFISFDIILKV